jgi:hypothetical protein
MCRNAESLRRTDMTTVTEYRPLAVWRNAMVNGLGMLQRAFGALLDAVDESRRKQAQRVIARYAALQSNHMTDELEREIMRRLLASD